ncbi:MAG: hypothetical protein IJT77_09760 [Clostridia bacterium]|nr:hypothetical protein [Clostridia bacterium]
MKSQNPIKTIVAVLVFILCFSLTVGTYARYGQFNLDSDMSSDMVLADLLNEEGRIVTTNYYYSGELNILSPIMIFQVALRLFPSWHVARTVSIGFMILLMSAALIYLGTGAGVSIPTCILAASALMMPVSKYQAFTLIYGSFYMIWATLAFYELGLILRMKRKRPLEPILLALYGIVGSLSGVRMLMICAAPVAVACVLNFYVEARKAKSLREALAVPAFPTLVGSLICVVSNVAGYLISTNVLANIYHFKEFGDTAIKKLENGMLTEQIRAVMEFFGYRAESLLLSTEGLYSLFVVALPVLGIICIILLLRMRQNAEERLLTIYVLIALIMGMIINVLVSFDANDTYFIGYSVSYYMPAVLLLVFSIFWFLDRFECSPYLLRVLPMLLSVCLFVLGFNIYKDQEMNTYDDEMTVIADTILNEGCTEGYATYWLSNVLTEVSDGKLNVYMVEDWESGRIGDWLQRLDHLTTEPQGRIFAIFSEDDFNNERPGCDYDHLIYSSPKAYICVYEDVNEFHELRGDL